MEKGGQLTETSIQWTKNLSSLPPFTHELLKRHLITDTTGKYRKPSNVHKHKKSGLMLFKYKMVTQVKVKSNVKKGEAIKIFSPLKTCHCCRSIVHVKPSGASVASSCMNLKIGI